MKILENFPNSIGCFFLQLVLSWGKTLHEDEKTLDNLGQSSKMNEQEAITPDSQSSCYQSWLTLGLLRLLIWVLHQYLWDLPIHPTFKLILVISISIVSNLYQYRHMNNLVSVFHWQKKRWCLIFLMKLRQLIIGSESK